MSARRPESRSELLVVLNLSTLSRVYDHVTAAAVRKRLTEQDIAAIERDALDFVGRANDMADELEGIEVEVVAAKVRSELKKLFDGLRSKRVARQN